MVLAPELTAHSSATKTSIDQVASYLQRLLGQRATALLANARDPKTVGSWARGENEPRADAERRLRNGFQVAELLMQAESEQTVRAWFLGMNPQLEDRAPLLVLAEDPAAVLRAARGFLAGG